MLGSSRPFVPCADYGTRCDECKRAEQRLRDQRRGTPAQRGYGYAWRVIRKRVLEAYGYRCHYCGGEAKTVDHVVPLADGGTADPSNLVAACVSCNSSRGGKRAHNGGTALGIRPMGRG